MARLTQCGLPVAPTLPTAQGRLVETIPTPLGNMHAMLVEAAAGEEVGLEDLTVAQARAWGALLAWLHTAGSEVAVSLPDSFAELDLASDVLAGDQLLIDAVERLRDHLRELPRNRDTFGVVHGDCELDNMAWVGDTPTTYDLDEAARSWFVADIAYALRDVVTGADRVEQLPIGKAFLDGYRSQRQLSDVELAKVGTFSAAHSAVWLTRLQAILDTPPQALEAPWLTTLRAKLIANAGRQRAIVLDHAGARGG